MNDKLMTDLANFRITQWMAEEKERRERQESSTPSARRVITISRQYGAGGHSIAELTARRLGPPWEIWDKEIVDEVARTAKVRTSLVDKLDEHSRSRLEDILRYVANRWDMSPEHYYRHLVEVLLALSQQGNKIIIGRGANFVLSKALRVRLCSSHRFRINAIMARDQLSEADARARIAHVEAERTQFVESFFHKDVNDPSEYDLNIHVDHIGFDAAAAAIVGAMNVICEPRKDLDIASKVK